MAGLEMSELKDAKGVCALEGAIVEPNDSDRFISGGERSEETVRRLLGGDLYVGFAIVQRRRREAVASGSRGRGRLYTCAPGSDEITLGSMNNGRQVSQW
jgi:hypothetical protein